MGREMVLYRGSLKSCNYGCSYCPFAKGNASPAELQQDQEDWFRFCAQVQNLGPEYGAVMVVPYGEALIHPYYWEGLAQLSRMDSLEAIGAQTNLSFSIRDQLHIYQRSGGDLHKLRLWATFHPEMVTISRFVRQCRLLLAEGVRFCAGAVGIPENIGLLQQLRRELPQDIYLWINRMDGLKRRYSQEETAAFLAIDPWFSRELHWKKADPAQCRKRLFLEADGRMRLCNISEPSVRSRYDETAARNGIGCGKKFCSCYLAYGGRKDLEQRAAFGRYPLFRIPWQAGAVFLDLDGTLLCSPSGAGIGKEQLELLKQESSKHPVFLATSRPLRDASLACADILPFLSGGIYSSGAHIVFYGREQEEKQERFHTFEAPWMQRLTRLSKTSDIRFRILPYRHGSSVYKITLEKPKRRPWKPEEAAVIASLLPTDQVRYFVEGHCLQVVGAGVDKGSGIREICDFLKILPSSTAAVGNSAEDIPMFRLCGYGVAVEGSPDKVAEAADLVIYHKQP